MPGRAKAVSNGEELKRAVLVQAESLGLAARSEVKAGRRIWGAVRRIDVVLTDPATNRKLGIECKYQGGLGTAEEKIPAMIQDIRAWPIRGIVVISGSGFSPNMRGFLISTGIVVDFEDLADWLTLYFGLAGTG